MGPWINTKETEYMCIGEEQKNLILEDEQEIINYSKMLVKLQITIIFDIKIVHRFVR